MNGIQVDINHLKKGEVSLGTSMYVTKANISLLRCLIFIN